MTFIDNGGPLPAPADVRLISAKGSAAWRKLPIGSLKIAVSTGVNRKDLKASGSKRQEEHGLVRV